jgi:hypothetical protein
MIRLGRVAACVALGVALTACSGGNKVSVTDNPKAALTAASERTAKAHTVKMNLTASTSNVPIVDGTGAYDFDKKTGRFTLKGALISSIDLVITPDKTFVRTPKGPKAWASLTQADIDKSGSGGLLSSIRSQVDPRATLANLGQTTKNVTVVGQEKVDGVKTTHLRGEVDVSEAAIAKAPKDQQDSLRQARQAIGTDSYPIQVWLDDAGRVRRVSYELTAGQAAQRATTTVELHLYDFGKDPGIEIPKPADVQAGLN